MNGNCWHCGEPLPGNAPLRVTIAGVARPVCSRACRSAAQRIADLGFADYYRLRDAPAPRPPERGETDRAAAAWGRPALERHVVRELPGNRRETVVLVEGLRCAACALLVERTLGSVTGVEAVHVNAGARRARIVWDPVRAALPQLIDALAQAGYAARPLDGAALDDARRREARDAQKRLVVAGFGAMQAMMYASALYFGAIDPRDPSTRELFRWLGLVVATPVVLYAARPFFAGALRVLAARRLGMDVPVALAIALIYAASVIAVLRGGADVYFDSVSMFVFFLLTGRYLEMRARHRSCDLSDALARIAPAFAERETSDGTLVRVGALELLPGDRVHVAHGAGVPADGVLEGGRCRVDEALLSGEAEPIDKRDGDPLVAGSVVVEGTATMRVTRVGADTVLSGIVALIGRASTARPRLAQAGERAAAAFVARVLVLAALTAAGWSLVDPQRAFAATLAVLVVSCPCAFALAVPAALTRALTVLARRGVLVVRPDAIEQLARATHAMFDKTGTLTDPQIAIDRIEVMRADDRDLALVLAAALARGSRHPVAQAIATAAGTRRQVRVESPRTEAGCGSSGVIEGRRLRLGRADFALAGAPVPAALADAVVLADDGGAIAAFHVSERLRPGTRTAIDALRASGLAVDIVSGDAPGRVAAIAARLAVPQWRARAQPADKLAHLAALRAAGERVIAIGDGINDAPLLAGADVAVAIASGADIAQASSDIVLAADKLTALADARALARETLAILRQNQRWALGYNLTAVPLAALGFVPPWLAAIGMSVSSIVVILNALRIGRGSTASPPAERSRDGGPDRTSAARATHEPREGAVVRVAQP